MKKFLSLLLLLVLAISLCAAPVAAATYQDGAVIYSQDFNSVSDVTSLGYDPNKREKVLEATPSQNISIAIENKMLKVTAASGNGLYFIEILKDDVIKDVSKFTIEYDLQVVTAAADDNNAIGMLVYWDTSKGKSSGNIYSTFQFRNAYTKYVLSSRSADGSKWEDYAAVLLNSKNVTNVGLNTTHHIKMEVDGSTITGYVDGINVGATTKATPCVSPVAILVYNNNATSSLVAYLDNIKIRAGVNLPAETTGNTGGSTTAPQTSSTLVPVMALCALAAASFIIIRRKKSALSK